jgi:hypothetical protein
LTTLDLSVAMIYTNLLGRAGIVVGVEQAIFRFRFFQHSKASSMQYSQPASEQDSALYSSFITMDTSITKLDEKDTRTPVRSIVRALLASEWREDDLFQVPLLL